MFIYLFLFRMPYQGNMLGMVPLAEAPVPKDRWISPEAEVLLYQPIKNEEADDYSELLLSGVVQEVRVNPEIPGGSK
jgi:hypothetical protein